MTLPIDPSVLDEHEARMLAELGRDDIDPRILQCRIELLLHHISEVRTAAAARRLQILDDHRKAMHALRGPTLLSRLATAPTTTNQHERTTTA